MGILEDIQTSGVDPNNKAAVVAFIRNLPVSPDRREGLFNLWLVAKAIPRDLRDIAQVRGT